MAKKIIAGVVAVILIIGISVGTTLLVDKNTVPVSTTIEDGLSAYELAVQYGYEGTVQEWLTSLEGKSAYQIAADSGYSGTESEWLASLKATSDNTANIKNAQFSSKGELILTLSDGTAINLGVAVGADGKEGVPGRNGANGQAGKDGVKGQDGAKGNDGMNGKDGISISTATINNEGQLVLSFTDGRSVNLGKVAGTKGEAGVGISSSKINDSGELVLTYTNGQEANLGVVIGTDGKDGKDGNDGKDGIDTIVSTSINNAGELVITYSDGISDNLGVVVGADGKDGINGQNGIDGQNGLDGKDGNDGVSVISAEIISTGDLVLTYSNGQISNLGRVIGADGKDGVDGADGQDGISIIKSEINSKGELVITYSNNEIDNFGVVVGADGKDGTNGQDGKDGKDGKQGENGVGIQNIVVTDGNLSITLTNGTTMDLGNIKGADGQDGIDGKDGENGADGKDGIGVSGAVINNNNELVLTFSDNSEKNLGVVVGADGKDGIDGKNGADGKDGVNGIDGQNGRGIKKTEINALGELIITYTDDTADNLGVVISDNGGAGTSALAPRVRINATTNEWEISTDGGKTWISTEVKATGTNGASGKDGADGVSITNAVINENNELVLTFSDGREKDLGVVIGADGKDGKDGVNGTNGEDGKTPYIKNGNWWIDDADTGVKAEGVDGVNGQDGVNGTDGQDGRDGIGVSGAEINDENHLIIRLSNNDIMDVGVVVGTDGKDGTNGKDGTDGVGIKNITITDEGVLTITLDNDTVFKLGNIKGKDGIGIAKAEINSEGKLVITYTDGKDVTLGKVVGNDGISIKAVELTDDYMLELTFTDNSTQTVGPIRGEKGADGKTPYVKNGNWWIGDTDTGIKAEGIDGNKGDKGDKGDTGEQGVGVANSYVDDSLHLWLVLSDGTKIDAGYVGGSGGGTTPDPTPAIYTVTFKDWNGTVLKTQTVESGKAATAPEAPVREGYVFAGWNGNYTNVVSNVEIIATYIEKAVPMLSVSNANASAGATKVTLTVSLKNNPGFLTMALKTTFNSDVLTLTKVTTGIDYIDYSFTGPKNKVSGCTAAWFASDLPEEIIDGDIMTLQFTVNSNAASGRYPVTISCPDDGSTVDGNKTAFNMPDAIGYIDVK